MVMVHELTHGFDDQGRQYDGSGTLRQWWTNTSVSEFKRHATCFENQYGHYEYRNGTFSAHVNGLLTLGENIADNGGIHLSYKVHRKAVEADAQVLPQTSPPTTADQLFFLRYAQNWCQLTTDEYIRNQLLTDPHSPAFARVNGPLSNFEPFAQAFKCPPGSPMNPTKKCSLY
jgi:predicted metalloendopeptidase